MIIESFIIIFIIFIILAIFYLRTVDEYRINQINWSDRKKIPKILWERVPIIIQDIPPITCWTKQDRHLRFQEYNRCQTPADIEKVSGILHWCSKENLQNLCSYIIRPTSALCATGHMGLFQTKSEWTCIVPTDEQIQVSLIKKSIGNHLPNNWRNRTIDSITSADTPFVADIKFIDIIVKKGILLLLPPHMYVEINTEHADNGYCFIYYDSLFSYIAKRIMKN